jgi:hypothetical protein
LGHESRAVEAISTKQIGAVCLRIMSDQISPEQASLKSYTFA